MRSISVCPFNTSRAFFSSCHGPPSDDFERGRDRRIRSCVEVHDVRETVHIASAQPCCRAFDCPRHPSRYSWVDAGGRGSSHKQRVANRGTHSRMCCFPSGYTGHLRERGDQLCAFLDDIYVLCARHRVVPLFKQLSESLERVAGIRLHQRKTRVWNAGGIPQEDVHERLAVTRAQSSWDPRGHQLSPQKSCV